MPRKRFLRYAFTRKGIAENAPYLIKDHESVTELYRISGEGCYWMRVRTVDQEALTAFLDELLKYGNYRVNLDMGQIK
ncbi:Lrp/AsnC ligand binding domain-containing protein [Paenibacillus sp. FSL K6-1217]|uniref:Lrp/AsnC ligand binding domain-containing protein n=1 Tax=Paenibacillus sp. FSL K6-1217 TaxID=2921466 RepID=UPI0032546B63